MPQHRPQSSGRVNLRAQKQTNGEAGQALRNADQQLTFRSLLSPSSPSPGLRPQRGYAQAKACSKEESGNKRQRPGHKWKEKPSLDLLALAPTSAPDVRLRSRSSDGECVRGVGCVKDQEGPGPRKDGYRRRHHRTARERLSSGVKQKELSVVNAAAATSPGEAPLELTTQKLQLPSRRQRDPIITDKMDGKTTTSSDEGNAQVPKPTPVTSAAVVLSGPKTFELPHRSLLGQPAALGKPPAMEEAPSVADLLESSGGADPMLGSLMCLNPALPDAEVGPSDAKLSPREPPAPATRPALKSCLKRPHEPTPADSPVSKKVCKTLRFNDTEDIFTIPANPGKSGKKRKRRTSWKHYPVRSADFKNLPPIDASKGGKRGGKRDPMRAWKRQESVRQYWLREEEPKAAKRLSDGMGIPKRMMAVVERQTDEAGEATSVAKLETALRAREFMSMIGREWRQDRRNHLRAKNSALGSGRNGGPKSR